jgi:uncharacterized phage protein (TIGR02218 family)
VTAWLDGALTTLAFCWRLERRDGIALGFTSHDRDLVIGGLPYRAAPGMMPSAVEKSDGLDADAVDVTGALTSDAIRADDLRSGRWDGAALALFAVDWTAPEDDPVPITRGELGAIGTEGGQFTAELRGPTAMLERPVVEETSPECRAELGDRRCRIDLSGRQRIAAVVAIDDEMVTLDSAEPVAGGWAWGTLRWIDGPNSGLRSAILASAGAVVTLREPPPFVVEPGTRAMIVEGCDKRLSTCAGRFGNAVNFRGEPHLPGNDLLTRYPGG